MTLADFEPWGPPPKLYGIAIDLYVYVWPPVRLSPPAALYNILTDRHYTQMFLWLRTLLLIRQRSTKATQQIREGSLWRLFQQPVRHQHMAVHQQRQRHSTQFYSLRVYNSHSRLILYFDFIFSFDFILAFPCLSTAGNVKCVWGPHTYKTVDDILLSWKRPLNRRQLRHMSFQSMQHTGYCILYVITVSFTPHNIVEQQQVRFNLTNPSFLEL
jgi:hypothetical protein